MNVRQRHLIERDVRKLAPENEPASFLALYLASNFPETIALPSPDQKEGLVREVVDEGNLKYMKKPLSGPQFDNPGGS